MFILDQPFAMLPSLTCTVLVLSDTEIISRRLQQANLVSSVSTMTLILTQAVALAAFKELNAVYCFNSSPLSLTIPDRQ